MGVSGIKEFNVVVRGILGLLVVDGVVGVTPWARQGIGVINKVFGVTPWALGASGCLMG